MTGYKPTPLFISFLQATGIALYCGLVGLFMMNANRWFPKPDSFVGPAVFLLLFVVSAVTCSLIFLGYPFMLIWEHKQTQAALKNIALSTAWLAFYILFLVFTLILSR